MGAFNLAIFYAFIFAAFAICTGFHYHDDLQMPLGYVKYPYQGVYPGDGEGIEPT
jgi:hypothetical protein